jgi:hypothetical protein
MITLFDYYGLKIHFIKTDCTPLHIYANRGKQSCIGHVTFKQGLFDKIEFKKREGFDGLDQDDANKMELLILNHLDEIVKRWIDFYIFKRPIEEEIITQRIEDAPFS